ncbi:MAG TPA: hypothetical protein VGK89_10235 [Candidatus Eisenbacteria bacterium]|jgi:hypothetical protein
MDPAPGLSPLQRALLLFLASGASCEPSPRQHRWVGGAKLTSSGIGFHAILVTALLASPAHALTFRPGLEIGAGCSTFVRGSEAGPYTSAWSWHPAAAALLEITAPAGIIIVPAVRWAAEGTSSHASSPYTDDSNTANENWLTLDLMLKHRLASGLSAIIGTETAYMLTGSLRGQFNSPSDSHGYREDYAVPGNLWDERLEGGITYAIPLGAHRAEWSCRYLKRLVQETRPMGISNLQRNIAWTASPPPLPGGPTRTRAFVTGVTLSW